MTATNEIHVDDFDDKGGEGAVTAQRWEIEAWANRAVWDDPDLFEQVVDEIVALHSDDESEWLEVVDRHVAASLRQYAQTAGQES